MIPIPARTLPVTAALFLLACGSTPAPAGAGGGASEGGGGVAGANSPDGGTPAGAAGSAATAGGGNEPGLLPVTTSPSDAGPSYDDASCAAQTAATKLEPVRLLFAFDVSGSMGKLDKPYHDPALKWDPVVAATKAFFADPGASRGVYASLTFFPAARDKCDEASYEKPGVPMTELPSDAFAAAIDAVTPKTADDWRGGTPTLAVVQGTIRLAQSLAAADRTSRFAMVLVTDGYPQDCDDDSIAAVADAVRSTAATMPTYVIGVTNPPGGPDTVSNLNDVAKAGGTEAFLIETGDPTKTSADFRAVVEAIRNQSISCNLPIPAPPTGETLDANKVNVTYTSGTGPTGLVYDPQCETDPAWRYDDAARPGEIVLCPATCKAVQSDASANLLVEFGCAHRIPAVH